MKNKRRRLIKDVNVTFKVNSAKRKTLSLMDQPSDILDSANVVADLVPKSGSQEHFPFEYALFGI